MGTKTHITMKKLLIITFFITFYSGYSQQGKFLHFLTDSISNKKPTLLKLEVDSSFFAVERIAISNNGKTIYYSERNGYDSLSISKINKIQFSKGQWSKPSVFLKDYGAPTLSPNGKVMLMQYEAPKRIRGSISNKKGKKWSKPTELIHPEIESHYLQVTKTGKYYFYSSEKNDPKSNEIYSLEISGRDTIIKPTGIKNLVSSVGMDFFIARDESYIILTLAKRKEGNKFEFYGERDFFICFKLKDGNWGNPISLGKEINSFTAWKWGHFVTNDNKYFIFSGWSNPVGTYIIRFDEILENLKKGDSYGNF